MAKYYKCVVLLIPQVLEGAVCEGQGAQQQLLEHMVEQQQLVDQLQQQLAAAHRQHLAAQKALTAQTARVQALENMRLQDLRVSSGG